MTRARRGYTIPSVHVALAIARRADLPRKICGWCKKILREGAEPASHGLCPACKDLHFPEKPREPKK